MSTVTVKLQRPDSSQPWGFRIHGGSDFNQPLVILKVTAGSLSSQQGLEPGDQIISINGQDSLRLKHREAQQLILSCGNEVGFEVVRGDSAALQRALTNNDSAAVLESLKQSSTSKSSTTISSSSSTIIQSNVSSTAVTQAWTGPKFTEENIKEMMVSQAQVLDTGAIGVNFIKPEKILDPEKSAVLKMLKEIETERKERARSPSVPPPTGESTFGIYMNRSYEAAMQAQIPQAPWANRQQLSPSIRVPAAAPPPPQTVEETLPQQPEPETAASPVEAS